ncbi:MAG: phosphoserine phosphatase SerB [Nitrospiria bacterium]
MAESHAAVLTCLGDADMFKVLPDAEALLRDEGVRFGAWRTLASHPINAIEYTLTSSHPIDWRLATKRLRTLQGEFGVDLAVLPNDATWRSKKLLVMDMDSTLVQSEGIDELAKEAGVGDRVAAITRRAMNGELDFSAALRERVGLLRGLPIAALDRVADRTRLTPGAEVLIRVLRASECAVAVVSGGFEYFADRVRAKVPLDYAYANRLEIEEGRLTGRLLGDIVHAARKAELVGELARKEGISLERVLAIGDGANDLPMLERAGLGVAYHAKPAVRAVAPVTVGVGDLSAVLFFLGYTESDLAA